MFVRTERLLLRPGWIEDAAALAQALDDAGIARNLAAVSHPYTLADAEDDLARSSEGALPSLLMLARTARSPRLVGGIGLHRDDTGAVELRYWIARPFWGLGFATEAGRAMVTLAHRSLRLKRLVSGQFHDNPAAGHVLRKLGFRATGVTTARHSIARGGAVPCVLFAREQHGALSMKKPSPFGKVTESAV